MKDFAKLHGGFTRDDLLSIVSNKKKRKGEEPVNKEFQDVQQKRIDLDQKENAQKENLDRIATEIEELGPVWADRFSHVISYLTVSSIYDLFEVLEEMEEGLDFFTEPDAILETLNKEISKAESILNDIIEEVDSKVGFPEETFMVLRKSWSRCIDDDGGWGSTLHEFHNSANDFEAAVPSGFLQAIKGGGLGYAGAALFGPLGMVAAVGASIWDGNNTQEEYERAARRWHSAINSFSDSTERWEQNAQKHLEKYFSFVWKTIAELVRQNQTNQDAESVLQCLEEQIKWAQS
jgi:hypothetical protein